MEEYSVDDPTQLLQAASDFAYFSGVQNDDSAKNFLDRFPLPVVINALQTKADVPGLENTLVACLERIFQTKYGAYLIPQYMPFVQVGLKADSQIVRCLACKTVTYLLEHLNEETSAVQLISDYDVYPLLLDCLVNGKKQETFGPLNLRKKQETWIGNEQVATASMDAIKKLAGFPQGMGRVRVLALMVKLFSVSSSVASIIYKLNLLRLFEEEINNTNDTLVTLNVLELLYELSEIQHGREFLSGNSLLQLLSSIISNKAMEPILRSRAMMISGRLLHDSYMFVDESSTRTVIAAIDRILDSSETRDMDECESALEALGQIGSSIQGAQLLLSSSPPSARHIINAAFDRQGRGKQLAALHALGNISGETHPENNMILDNHSEENLRRLIFETASKTSKLTPSGLILSLLQQASEIRLAGYRMITGLVARPWFLMEICSKQEIINIVTDANTETTKIGMEARYNCCKAIQKALMSSSKVTSDASLAAIAEKVHKAVKMGPYLARKLEAQPVVMTAERF
ncbi:26S proteasome non-ATPase regulatory subunit 5 [Morus notabilis]|uniref:26S proteasome non-ATPase regulatory subunit 5 n=1 Tax=Morus notabilis TaxID=981085 RepID=W9RHT0_9ROSA|nr:26S proteasome non-ATPase regulatory subunit 5 [Morus notabilis]